MADFGTPVAQNVNVNPTQGLQTLSSILDIQRQQQALQTGQYAQQSAQADAQAKQQEMRERLAVSQMLRTGIDDQGKGIRYANGEIDPSRVLPALGRIAPYTGQNFAQAILKTESDKVGLQSAAASLDAKERQMLMGSVQSAALTGAKSDDINDGIDNLVAAHPEMANAAQYLKGLTPHLDTVTDPKQRADMVNNLAARLQVGQPVQTQPERGGVDSGAVQFQGTFAPPTAKGGGGFTPSTQILNQAKPAVVQLPNDSLDIVGGVYGVPPTGVHAKYGTAAPSKLQPLVRPAPNAPGADQANYKARIEAAGAEQAAVSQAANDPLNGVQATRFRNQQILDLAPHADTGPGLKIMNTIASRLPIKGSGDAYQDVEHYTAQNSAALAKLMGVPNTNLGHETALAAAGSVEKNPGALAEITKTNDALNTAFDLYNRGLAKVTNNGSDLSRAAAYKQAFGQNLDINAIRWADAHRRKDADEIATLQGKAGSTGIAEYARKLNVLKSLATKGDLP